MTTHDALWWLMAPNWWAPLVCGIVCAVHAVVDGGCDARHFDRPESKRQVQWPDIHPDFVMRRSAVWVLAALCAGVPTAIGCMMLFPYLHDGNYYFTRKLMDGNVYQQGWASEPSRTSTARWSFGYGTRCWFAMLGLIILATVIFTSLNHPTFVR